MESVEQWAFGVYMKERHQMVKETKEYMVDQF